MGQFLCILIKFFCGKCRSLVTKFFTYIRTRLDALPVEPDFRNWGWGTPLWLYGGFYSFQQAHNSVLIYLSELENFRAFSLLSLSLRPMLERKSRDRELRVIFPGVTGLHVHFSEQVPFRGNTSIKRQTLRTCSTR